MGTGDDSKDRFRRCRDCGEWKPLEDFQIVSRRELGRGSYCKPCFNERSKRSYAMRVAAREGRAVKRRRQDPPGHKFCPACQTVKPHDDFVKTRARTSGLHSYCKECHTRRARQTSPMSRREHRLRRRYGIGIEDFERMYSEQGGMCAICWAPKPEHVDHDHLTGKVRGLLCFNCNGGLGQFRDDSEVLTRAIEYLKKGTTWRWEQIGPGVFRRRITRSGPVPSPSS
jgi:hypothetical protein